MKGKILNIQKLVRSVLIKIPEARDNDRILCCEIWIREEPSLLLSSSTWRRWAEDFIKGEYTETETIRRTRQKIQEQHPELRGQNYQARQKAGVETTQDINTIQL